MKLIDLISKLQSILDCNDNYQDHEIVILADRSTLGSKPFVDIQDVICGFDWDAGKIFIIPKVQVKE